MKRTIKYCDRTLVRSPVYYASIVDPKIFKQECLRFGLKRSQIPEPLGPRASATTHQFTKANKVVCLVFFKKSVIKAIDTCPEGVIGIIAHEAMHIWQDIKKNLGESNPSEEFEAYSVQTIVEELLLSFNDAVRVMREGSKRGSKGS